jgi:hypothetical protein
MGWFPVPVPLTGIFFYLDIFGLIFFFCPNFNLNRDRICNLHIGAFTYLADVYGEDVAKGIFSKKAKGNSSISSLPTHPLLY